MTVSTAARPTPTGHPGYSETLPCEAASAEVARRLVRTALTVWGLDHVAEAGALVVTELVANAVQHARSRSLRVTVARPDDGRVCVGVMDKSRTLPVLRHAGDTEVDGRGLALVDALTSRWGTDLKARGKCVWAELEAECCE